MNSLMSLSDFKLDGLEIKTRSIFGSNSSSKDSQRQLEIRIEFGVFKRDKKLEFLVPLTIQIAFPEESGNFEKIVIRLSGVFKFPGETPEEEIARYVPLLCLTNLFGTARGVIAQATAMCMDGPFILPLVNMNKLIKEFQESAPEEAGETTPVRIAASAKTKKKAVGKKPAKKKKAATKVKKKKVAASLKRAAKKKKK